MIDQEDFLQAPRIQNLRDKIASAETEEEKRRFLVMLTKEIVKSVNNISSQKFDDGVSVKNFDEVTATLRNELNRASKPIAKLLGDLKLSTDQQSEILTEIENNSQKDISKNFDSIIIKRPRDFVSVDNLNEIPCVEDVSVNNLGDLEQYFTRLAADIRDSLNINIPTPQVTVNPPQINLPEQRIDLPAIDLSGLLNALESVNNSLKLIKNNNKSNPLAVRLTDGGDWVKELRKQNAQTQQFMTDVSYIKNATGTRINPATDESVAPPDIMGDGSKSVTTAGTRVTLGTGVCRKVFITANETNTDTVWIGGITIAAGRGTPLVALQTYECEINNLSKVYLDADVSGEGVYYSYVA